MKHVLFVFVGLLVSFSSLWAQGEKRDVRQLMADAQKMLYGTTLSFVQTKHSSLLKEDIVSRGTLAIHGENDLRWQYTEPTSLVFVIKGDSIYTINNGKQNDLKGPSGRIAKYISQLISTLASGNTLFDDKLFDCIIDTSNSQVTLIPKRRDMKRFMESMLLHFNAQTYNIQSVKIIENKENYTLISFSVQ